MVRGPDASRGAVAGIVIPVMVPYCCAVRGDVTMCAKNGFILGTSVLLCAGAAVDGIGWFLPLRDAQVAEMGRVGG